MMYLMGDKVTSEQMAIEEFYDDLNQGIISESRSREMVRSEAFFENICEELIENAELSSEYDFAFYQDTGVEVCGYSYDEERKILSLMVSSYFQDDDFEKIKIDRTKITAKFKRLKTGIVLLNYDFEGGEFELEHYGICDLGMGDSLWFDARLMHQVKPITDGIRYSLVIWFLGPPFI